MVRRLAGQNRLRRIGGFIGRLSILVFVAWIDGGLLAAFKPGTGLAELTSPSHSRP